MALPGGADWVANTTHYDSCYYDRMQERNPFGQSARQYRCSAISKMWSLRIFPLTRARLLDFADLKTIRHHPSRSFNLSRVFWTTFFLFMIRVVSSLNAFIGGMFTPLPMCASGILDPAAFSRICIASNMEGEIVHPIAIPTSKRTHLLVYVLVENRITNPLKYSWRMWITGCGTWWASNVFHRSWCGTDPYAFARSIHTTYRLSRFLLALWMASQIITFGVFLRWIKNALCLLLFIIDRGRRPRSLNEGMQQV